MCCNCPAIVLLLQFAGSKPYCQAQGLESGPYLDQLPRGQDTQGHSQVSGLDLEFDSIIGTYHHPP